MGAPTLIGGTSASSPTFASLLTRVNEVRISKGMSTVGFVNPTIVSPNNNNQQHALSFSQPYLLSRIGIS